MQITIKKEKKRTAAATAPCNATNRFFVFFLSYSVAIICSVVVSIAADEDDFIEIHFCVDFFSLVSFAICNGMLFARVFVAIHLCFACNFRFDAFFFYSIYIRCAKHFTFQFPIPFSKWFVTLWHDFCACTFDWFILFTVEFHENVPSNGFTEAHFVCVCCCVFCCAFVLNGAIQSGIKVWMHFNRFLAFVSINRAN